MKECVWYFVERIYIVSCNDIITKGRDVFGARFINVYKRTMNDICIRFSLNLLQSFKQIGRNQII